MFDSGAPINLDVGGREIICYYPNDGIWAEWAACQRFQGPNFRSITPLRVDRRLVERVTVVGLPLRSDDEARQAALQLKRSEVQGVNVIGDTIRISMLVLRNRAIANQSAHKGTRCSAGL